MSMKIPNEESTILLVDDDEDIRKNATLILGLEGYTVYSASDGEEALKLLTTGRCNPTLIVSDIAMPHLDGYEFFQAVRQIPAMRLVPFIFLSAHGSKRHIRFGRELGVDDYLVKPFDPDDLLASVRNRIGRDREFRQTVERELDNARRALVQLLSHELRTPLTYITGGFELLADSLRQEGGARDVDVSIGLIRSGTQRLTRLAEQVVRYAELVSGHALLQINKLGEKTSLVGLIDSAITLARAEIEAHSIDLKVDYHLPDTAEIFTVPDLFITAVYEALRNAVSYSPEKSSVCIEAHVQDGSGIVAITDHGRGIPPDDLKNIWQIMMQSEREKHEQQGAGMGLPIIKQTMLLHGGDVTLASTIDQGTTVTLRVPLCAPEEQSKPEDQSK
jgi:signal transduction histidine kinase